MRITQEIKQHSPQWLEWRKNGIGSSDVAVILCISPFKKLIDLYLEKIGEKPEQDYSNNFVVQRGVYLEPIARDQFNKMIGANYEPALFQHDDYEFMRYSSDGYDPETDSLIEIKCNGSKSHNLALENTIPDYYLAQIQYGLLVSKAKYCYYISYNPDHPTPLIYLKVTPDSSLQSKIESAVKDFWINNVLKKNSPKDGFDSAELPESIKEKIDQFRSLKLELDEKNKYLENLEIELKDYFKSNDIKYTNYNGVFFELIERKGTIDYSKIPELQGVDLEKYRKKPTEYYKISIK